MRSYWDITAYLTKLLFGCTIVIEFNLGFRPKLEGIYMVTFNLVVMSPSKERADRKRKKIVNWPVLPRTGEEFDIAPPGCAGGVTATVTKVTHWLGVPDIDVYCEIQKIISETQKDFDSLKKEDGWET